MKAWASYVLVCATTLFVVYGQIAIKSRVLHAGPLPVDFTGRVRFIFTLLTDPWVLSALFAALLASITWMLALSKLPLSHAYPFASGSFVLVLLLSNMFFAEPITWPKIAGVSLIVLGVAVSSQG